MNPTLPLRHRKSKLMPSILCLVFFPHQELTLRHSTIQVAHFHHHFSFYKIHSNLSLEYPFILVFPTNQLQQKSPRFS